MCLTNIFLTSEYRLGSVLECSDILLLILMGIISDFGRLLCRLESDCPLKCHNRVPTCLCAHSTIFCLSVSDSTAYWLHCINSYMQPHTCSMPT